MSSTPLTELRKLMAAEGLAALIVPTEDSHQSEYALVTEKRLKFISHFTGSAGTALIGLEKAWLWTDGRYFNQATAELPQGWTLMKIGLPETPALPTFSTQEFPEGASIGVDAKLLSNATAHAFQKTLKKKGQVLKFTSDNLIDRVWKDKPQVSAAEHKVKVLDDKLTGKSVADKLSKLRKDMTAAKASYHVVTALDHIAWLYNIRGSDIDYNPVVVAYSIVSHDKATVYVNQEKLDDSVKSHFSGLVEFKPYEEFFSDARRIAQDTSKTVWLDPGSSAAIYEIFPKKQTLSQESSIILDKAIKNPTELEGMRQSSLRDASALVRFFCWLESELNSGSKISECQASDKLLSFRQQISGFVSPSFATISSTGSNAAIIHYKPEPETCAIIDKNQIYLCDSGGQYTDGTTDVTRTFHFGTPTPKEKQVYTAVLKGHIALDVLTFPQNTNGLQIDAFARSSLWNLGLDYRHGTGHGVGHYLCVHEGPHSVSFRARSVTHVIQKDMTVTNEPGYYEDGEFGIRIENILVTVPKKTPFTFGGDFLGFEHITFVPLDHNLIDTSMLTKEEVEWINTYHANCLKKTGSLLDKSEDAYKWLESRTKPLAH